VPQITLKKSSHSARLTTLGTATAHVRTNARRRAAPSGHGHQARSSDTRPSIAPITTYFVLNQGRQPMAVPAAQ
jgi:hypothetical protein